MPKHKQPLFLEFAVVIFIVAYTFQLQEPTTASFTAYTAHTFSATHVRNFSFVDTANILHYKHTPQASPGSDRHCLAILLILLAGDIQTNPGPGNRSTFPCGTCDIPVTWSQEGVCCNNCSVWYHKSCEDLSSRNMSYLGCSSVIWHCCKCDSINVDSFTFNSFELFTSNIFTPLTDLDTTFKSVASSSFSQLHTSSPQTAWTNPRHRRQTSTNSSISSSRETGRSSKTQAEFPMKSTNLRLLTVNCCGIHTNKAEFAAALDYTKPDLVCGTESWLRGIKPGQDPAKNTIKSSEVFPPEYTIHRNDRSIGLRGGVFIATREGLITDAQPQLTTDCEIVWSKVKARNKKDIYLCSFYMPHRNLNDINRLDDSLRQITQCKTGKHIILAGDFNCPDFDWENMSVKKGAADREVQQALLDLSIEHGLTQVHDQPTRDLNMLDLVFTKNPSTVKTSTSIPGISDHAMIVTDIDIIPQYVKQTQRKFYIFSKANWDNIQEDMCKLSHSIMNSVKGSSIEEL